MQRGVWLLAATALAASSPAFAQQQADTAGPGEKDNAQPQADANEVIVTATRREKPLSEVPLAVTAVSGRNLRYSGASDIRDLDQLAPSLLVSSTGSEAGAAVARIRGVGTVGDNPGLESSVPVFIDGVYRSRVGIGLTELGPLERVEVLRGPQGTLFGRNASAGLISVFTAKPRFQPEVDGALSFGNYGMRRADATITAPVTTDLAGRIDAVVLKRDGFLRDTVSGRDFNDRNRWLVRGQALYQPDNKLTVRIIGDYAQHHEQCCAAVYLPLHDTVKGADGSPEYLPSSVAALERALGAVIDDNSYARHASVTPGHDYNSDVDDYGLSAQADYEFSGLKLTSISAWRYNNFVRGQDLDYSNLDILFRNGDGHAGNRFSTLTQELRLQGRKGRLDWLVGGFLQHENLRLLDDLSHGNDFARYANCLTASGLAAANGKPALLDPASATCFDTDVATALLPNLSQNQQQILSAFARLGTFAGPDFTDSGYSNLAASMGLPGQTLNGVGLADRWRQVDDNWALFTHDIVTLASGLDLTLGARFTHDRKRITAALSDNNSLCEFLSANLPSQQGLPCSILQAVPGGSLSGGASHSENNLSGTAILSYKFGRTLTYASYSRGYKAGGFNLDRSGLARSGGTGAILPTADFNALEFKPEINDAFELGTKYDGRAVDLNVAIFHELFSNFQLNTFNGLNFIVENINACKADLNGADIDNSSATGACAGGTRAGVRSQGVEIEGFTQPVRYVGWNVGVTYADTRYRHNLVGSDGRALTSGLFQLPGRRVSNSNLWTLTSSLAWTPPVGGSGMTALVYADARYMSPFNTGSDLDIEKTQDAFTIVNARIGLRGSDQRWAIELWAQNLLNAKFAQVAFDEPLQGSGTERAVLAGFSGRSTQLYGEFPGEPRTYGVTFRTKI